LESTPGAGELFRKGTFPQFKRSKMAVVDHPPDMSKDRQMKEKLWRPLLVGETRRNTSKERQGKTSRSGTLGQGRGGITRIEKTKKAR